MRQKKKKNPLMAEDFSPVHGYKFVPRQSYGSVSIQTCRGRSEKSREDSLGKKKRDKKKALRKKEVWRTFEDFGGEKLGDTEKIQRGTLKIPKEQMSSPGAKRKV